MVNIAINGFGRIGRLILRASIDDPDIEIAAINDLTDPGTLAHLLRYDSVHGKFNGTIEAKKSSIEVNGNDIPVYAKKEPNKLPWKKADVDVVMECTGRFREKNQASLHLKAGAKKIMAKLKRFFMAIGQYLMKWLRNTGAYMKAFGMKPKVTGPKWKPSLK